MLKISKFRFSYSLIVMLLFFILFETKSIYTLPIIILSALIHECGHILVAKIYRIPINSVIFDIFGALIEADLTYCSYRKELIFSLGGPIANLTTAILAMLIHPYGKNAKLFIVSSLLLAFINLLPAKDLDGGRFFKCILINFTSLKNTLLIINITSLLSIFFLWSISVYFIMKTGSYFSLFVFSSILFAKIFINIHDI